MINHRSIFSLVIILFILIGRRAKGWVWGRNCIVGNWKMVNDIISHERRSKVLTSQTRHAAKRNLFSFNVDSADYVPVLLPILDNLTGIYSWLFIDVLSLLPPEWSITVCKVNAQCPLTLLRILWQSYRYIDISWLFIDVLSFLPPIPEWSITFYKVNVQFPPQPHLELTITVYLFHYYVMFQTPLPTHPPLNGTSPFELYRLLIIKPNLPPPPPPPPTPPPLPSWMIHSF